MDLLNMIYRAEIHEFYGDRLQLITVLIHFFGTLIAIFSTDNAILTACT